MTLLADFWHEEMQHPEPARFAGAWRHAILSAEGAAGGLPARPTRGGFS